MDKGVENPEERNLLFYNVFFIIILYYNPLAELI